MSEPELKPNVANVIAPYNYPSAYNQDLSTSIPPPLAQNQNQIQNQQQQQQGTQAGPPMSPRSATAAAQAFNLDPALLQTTIGSLLQSPAAATMFLNSLNNSVQAQSLTSPTKNQPIQPIQSNYPFPAQYGPNGTNNGLGNTNPNVNSANYDFNALNNFNPNGLNGYPNQNQGYDPTIDNSDAFDPTLALLSPLPNHDALLTNNHDLLNAYEKADKMGTNVANLQETFDSLVRSMGLEIPDGPVGGNGQGMDMGDYQFDSGQGQGQGQVYGQIQGQGQTQGQAQGHDDLGPEFNMDDFLNELAKGDGMGGGGATGIGNGNGGDGGSGGNDGGIGG